ncbi:MAG: NTP transferase domain-containing protein [Desulfobacterales bacterium]|nr:NTP transferase domain-containing protein [Desulfobacterales bacterium]
MIEDVAIIILAAGKGTRMKSDLAKVLHPVAGKSMILHVVECAMAVAPDHLHVIVGHQADMVKSEVSKNFSVYFAIQEALLGTGDAVRSALPGLAESIRHVLVLCGDVPLIRKKTIRNLVKGHKASGVHLSVLAVNVPEPKGYGRIIQGQEGTLLAIREEADATEGEKNINLVNSGIYCFDRDFLESGIKLIGNDNNQDEYYLTDLVEIAVSKGLKTRVEIMENPNEVIGVNTLTDLEKAEVLFQQIQDELP